MDAVFVQVAAIFIDVALIGIAVCAVIRQISLVLANIFSVAAHILLPRGRLRTLCIDDAAKQSGNTQREHTSLQHRLCVHVSLLLNVPTRRSVTCASRQRKNTAYSGKLRTLRLL